MSRPDPIFPSNLFSKMIFQGPTYFLSIQRQSSLLSYPVLCFFVYELLPIDFDSKEAVVVATAPLGITCIELYRISVTDEL